MPSALVCLRAGFEAAQFHGVPSKHCHKKPQAQAEIWCVARVVARWREHFVACGVTQADIAMLAEQIDRPFLREQRTEFSASDPA